MVDGGGSEVVWEGGRRTFLPEFRISPRTPGKDRYGPVADRRLSSPGPYPKRRPILKGPRNSPRVQTPPTDDLRVDEGRGSFTLQDREFKY